MYNILFDPKTIEFLEKLPINTSKRIFRKLEQTKENPHHYFERLVGQEAYKLRVGKYRIIADIKENTLLILVLEIGHRKNIYKKNKN